MKTLSHTASDPKELLPEIESKVARIAAFLHSEHRDALLIRRNENLAWITAGALTRRVLLPADTNVVSVLVTKEGTRHYLTTNNESARLADEDLAGIGFEAQVFPWSGDYLAEGLQALLGSASLASDTAHSAALSVDLTPLRTPLLSSEISRFRKGAQLVAEITSSLLLELEPGVTEVGMSAHIASRIWQAGLEPTVLLMAADDRILKYKHALPWDGTLRNFGMLNLCARYTGLCISITRFVHFGALPQKLQDGFAAAAYVNATLLAASQAGATGAHLFAVARDAYIQAGFPGEETLHHQGGPAGYMERDWVATPTGQQKLVDGQALAWNASARGGKVEDTTLLIDGRMELLTSTPNLPAVVTRAGGAEFVSAGVLIR